MTSLPDQNICLLDHSNQCPIIASTLLSRNYYNQSRQASCSSLFKNIVHSELINKNGWKLSKHKEDSKLYYIVQEPGQELVLSLGWYSANEKGRECTENLSEHIQEYIGKFLYLIKEKYNGNEPETTADLSGHRIKVYPSYNTERPNEMAFDHQRSWCYAI
jgi:hypothetical protein